MKHIFLTFLSLLFATAAVAQTSIDWNDGPECGFYSKKPATKWEEYLLSGNGIMGVMVAGNPYDEKIVFNHTNLFLPLFEPLVPPSQGNHLKKIQDMLLDGHYDEASQLLVDISHHDGFEDKRQSDLFIPAFQLNIKSDSIPLRNYKREVDFSSAEASVLWQNKKGIFSRKCIASRPDSVIAIVYSAQSASINTTLSLSMVTNFDAKRKAKFKLDNDFNIGNVDITASQEGFDIKVHYKHPWKGGYKGYEGSVRIIPQGGRVTTIGDRIVLKGVKELLMLVRVSPFKEEPNADKNALATSLKAVSASYSTLYQSQQAAQQELMGRVHFDLNTAEEDNHLPSEELLKKGGSNNTLIKKLFEAGRYNIICATGTNPPNLQGIWGATMTPAWAGDYTTNGNLPTAVAHYLDASTPELMLSLFNKLESQMDYYKVNARVLFNCQGIHIPSHICLHGYDNQFDATWPMTFWTAGAAWYSIFYYDYYLHTLDRTFLSTRAFPFMEQAALFYDDFLKEGDDGKLLFNPSYSPENHPGNSKSQTCINATMDVMAAKSLYRNLISVGTILGLEKQKIAHWQTMLDKMPAYQLNENGELREWMWKDLSDNHKHRHASHLLGLFYFEDSEIMADATLREGCKKVIEQRLNYRKTDKNGDVMAFGLSQLTFPACILGLQDLSYEMLVRAGNSYWNSNLMTTHDSHQIFNADMSGAYPAIVLKMLAYSDFGLISLMPACPTAWSEGSVKGISLRGGIQLKEMRWTASTVHVVLHSRVSQTINLRLRGLPIRTVSLPGGQDIVIDL